VVGKFRKDLVCIPFICINIHQTNRKAKRDQT